MPRHELEQQAEDALVTGVKALGGMCLKLKFLGLPGAPDRLVLLPTGRFCFVELKKSKGGKLEPTQINLFPRLAKLGFPVRVLSGPDEVNDFLNAHR